MQDVPFPELRSFTPTETLVEALSDLLSRIEPAVSWRDFGRIPSFPVSASKLKWLRDYFRIKVLRHYGFLMRSPTSSYLLHQLEKRTGKLAAVLYKFLCLNHEIGASELAGILDEEHIDACLNTGLLLRREDSISLAVSLVPYRDYCYIAESRQVIDNRQQYGVDPAHIDSQTHLQIAFLERMLQQHKPSRILELGSGIGIVSLEMKRFARKREGAELYERNLAFAKANQQLRGDRDVAFYQSDLFSKVQGKFDLIIFNPWQPSENALELISDFLQQAPRHLADNGIVFLVVTTTHINGKETVIAEISDRLRQQNLFARRYIAGSWREFSESERRKVAATLSFLWITQSDNRMPPGTIKTVLDLPGLVYSVWKKRS